MKKSELLNKIADIHSRLEDNYNSQKAVTKELKEIIEEFDDIPDDVEEITDGEGDNPTTTD